MWKTGGLIDSLQWSLTFSLLPGKKQAMAWCLYCRFKRKKEEERCFSKQMEESIWGRIRSGNMRFGIQTIGGHPSTIILQTNIPVNKDLHT